MNKQKLRNPSGFIPLLGLVIILAVAIIAAGSIYYVARQEKTTNTNTVVTVNTSNANANRNVNLNANSNTNSIPVNRYISSMGFSVTVPISWSGLTPMDGTDSVKLQSSWPTLSVTITRSTAATMTGAEKIGTIGTKNFFMTISTTTPPADIALPLRTQFNQAVADIATMKSSFAATAVDVTNSNSNVNTNTNTNSNANTNATSSVPASWLTYTNSTFGFTLQYPADWNVTSTSDGYGGAMIRVSSNANATLRLSILPVGGFGHGAPSETPVITETEIGGHTARQTSFDQGNGAEYTTIRLLTSLTAWNDQNRLEIESPNVVGGTMIRNILSTLQFTK